MKIYPLKPWNHPRAQTTMRILLGGVLLFCLQSAVLACGYHDPKAIKTGVLNWIYPNSLHVNGAISRLQRADKLPPPDLDRFAARGSQRKFLDLVAYRKTVKALHSLGASLNVVELADQKISFSLVLVETALWTQFLVTDVLDANTHTRVEADGPRDGDLVVVTGEPVLYGLQEGQLTLLRAVELGVIRLYGTPEQVSIFLDKFGDVGDLPLLEAEDRLAFD